MMMPACPCRHHRDVADVVAAVAVAFAAAVVVAAAEVVVVAAAAAAVAVDVAMTETMAFHYWWCHCCTKAPVAVDGKKTAVIAAVAAAAVCSVTAATVVSEVSIVVIVAVPAASICHRPCYVLAVAAVAAADSCRTAWSWWTDLQVVHHHSLAAVGTAADAVADGWPRSEAAANRCP